MTYHCIPLLPEYFLQLIIRNRIPENGVEIIDDGANELRGVASHC